MQKLQQSEPVLMKLKNHDLITYEHSQRVAELLRRFGLFLGMESNRLLELYQLGVHHDIGKLYIDHEILTKEGKLTDSEFVQIYNHTIYGHLILKDKRHSEHFLNAVLYHHENYNGTGYPYRLKEKHIPLYAHMLRIVDSFDAMTNHRSYQKAYSKSYSLNEIQSLKGEHYHPLLVDKFNTMMNNSC